MCEACAGGSIALSNQQILCFSATLRTVPECHRREFGFIVSLLLRCCDVVSDADLDRALDSAFHFVLEEDTR
jgi:hypothetical protein